MNMSISMMKLMADGVTCTWRRRVVPRRHHYHRQGLVWQARQVPRSYSNCIMTRHNDAISQYETVMHRFRTIESLLKQRNIQRQQVTTGMPSRERQRASTTAPGEPMTHVQSESGEYYLPWIETRLMHGLRFHDKTTFRVIVAVIGTTAIISTVTLWAEIKQFFVGQTSEVAGTVLTTEDIQIKASDFAKAVLNQILTDDVVYKRALTFVEKLLEDPQTQQQLENLISNTLSSPEVRRQLYVLLEDEHAKQHLTNLLIGTVQDPESQNALLELLLWAISQESTKKYLQDLLAGLYQDQYLVDQGSDYLKKTIHQTLSDAKVKEHAIHFVNTALRDEALHKQGGDALWKAFTYSISPSWLSKPDALPTSDIQRRRNAPSQSGMDRKKVSKDAVHERNTSGETEVLAQNREECHGKNEKDLSNSNRGTSKQDQRTSRNVETGIEPPVTSAGNVNPIKIFSLGQMSSITSGINLKLAARMVLDPATVEKTRTQRLGTSMEKSNS